MEIKTSWIDLPGPNGKMRMYVAEPVEPGEYPGIMACHALIGLTIQHTTFAERIAAEGFVVAVPDLFHRAGYHLTFRFPEERDEAMKNTQHTNYFTWAQDSRTTLDWLRAQPNVNPERLATYGHCYGGTVAFVSAALNKDVKVALCCYPGGMVNRPMSPGQPVPPIMLIPEMNARVFLMSGNGDQNPSPADVEVIRAMMERYGKEFESHLYEGDPPAGHAFFEFGLVMHHEAASDWGWPIKLDYLRRALKDPVAVGV